MARQTGTGQPTVLKLLAGTRNSRINHDEPIPEDGIPQCPSPSAEVREVWDYTIAQLLKMRTVTMADRDALNTYCEHVVIYRKAAERVREEGAIYTGERGGMRKHPAVSVMNESANVIKNFGRDFGLTPSARSSIKVADQRPKQTQAAASRLLSG